MPWFIHTLDGMYNPSCMSSADGKMYAFAVCEPYTAGRLKAAWWVLTGRAYALAWPKAGDLERAIGMQLFDRSKSRPSGTQGIQSQK